MTVTGTNGGGNPVGAGGGDVLASSVPGSPLEDVARLGGRVVPSGGRMESAPLSTARSIHNARNSTIRARGASGVVAGAAVSEDENTPAGAAGAGTGAMGVGVVECGGGGGGGNALRNTAIIRAARQKKWEARRRAMSSSGAVGTCHVTSSGSSSSAPIPIANLRPFWRDFS